MILTVWCALKSPPQTTADQSPTAVYVVMQAQLQAALQAQERAESWTDEIMFELEQVQALSAHTLQQLSTERSAAAEVLEQDRVGTQARQAELELRLWETERALEEERSQHAETRGALEKAKVVVQSAHQMRQQLWAQERILDGDPTARTLRDWLESALGPLTDTVEPPGELRRATPQQSPRNINSNRNKQRAAKGLGREARTRS